VNLLLDILNALVNVLSGVAVWILSLYAKAAWAAKTLKG
jgi:hypothetical protein